MKSYLPYLLLIAGIIIGLSFGGDKEAEQQLIKKLELERKQSGEVISDLLTRDALKSAESKTIINELVKDTTEKGIEGRGYKRAAIKYQKLYENANLSRASVPELDSLRAAIRALHSN